MMRVSRLLSAHGLSRRWKTGSFRRWELRASLPGVRGKSRRNRFKQRVQIPLPGLRDLSSRR